MRYDASDLVTSVVWGHVVGPQHEDTVLVRYGYSADGRLAWRAEGAEGAPEWSLYDGGEVIQERSEQDIRWEYTWAGGQMVKAEQSGLTPFHLHHDRLGSVVLATRSENGVAVDAGHTAYDPYGRPARPPSWLGAPLPVKFGFTGARRDDLAAPGGLYLMGARWYDPELGRFIEQDPIGEGGGLNLYAYVGASPTMWVDPTGLASTYANVGGGRSRKFGFGGSTYSVSGPVGKAGSGIAGGRSAAGTDGGAGRSAGTADSKDQQAAGAGQGAAAEEAQQPDPNGATLQEQAGQGATEPTLYLMNDGAATDAEMEVAASTLQSIVEDAGYTVELVPPQCMDLQGNDKVVVLTTSTSGLAEAFNASSEGNLGNTTDDRTMAFVYVDRVRTETDKAIAAVKSGPAMEQNPGVASLVDMGQTSSGTALGNTAGHEFATHMLGQDIHTRALVMSSTKAGPSGVLTVFRHDVRLTGDPKEGPDPGTEWMLISRIGGFTRPFVP
ncbi:MAG: RHS repeat-associated core domain-containing protein [Acidobacteria bacterium]|nr:RHS repeat-associated core domain-containing protein [Acidobacteriota bacterium]